MNNNEVIKEKNLMIQNLKQKIRLKEHKIYELNILLSKELDIVEEKNYYKMKYKEALKKIDDLTMLIKEGVKYERNRNISNINNNNVWNSKE